MIKMDRCQDDSPQQGHLWMLGSQGVLSVHGQGRGKDHKTHNNQALLLGREQPLDAFLQGHQFKIKKKKKKVLCPEKPEFGKTFT